MKWFDHGFFLDVARLLPFVVVYEAATKDLIQGVLLLAVSVPTMCLWWLLRRRAWTETP